MPALPLRERLYRRILAYGAYLFKRRHQYAQMVYDSSSDVDTVSTGESGGDADVESSLSSDSSSSSDGGSDSSDSNGSSDTSSQDSDEELRERHNRTIKKIQELIKIIQETRVLEPHSVHKLSQLDLVLDCYYNDDPDRFRRNLRVSPATFDALLVRIGAHEVFISTGPVPQLPVREQLAIALFRFGHFGNAASVESIAQWAGVASGTVFNSTRRVMVIFLSLHDEVIHWPTAEEKEAAKVWVEATSCAAWRNGYCMVDGTLVPLSDKPGYHGEAYFDRKSNYSLNVQVCNLSY
jgi:hypothetical protein